jgi:hypothetical protein
MSGVESRENHPQMTQIIADEKEFVLFIWVSIRVICGWISPA